MRFPALILTPVLVLGLTAAHAASLPDTGQDLCDSGSNVLEACSSTNTGDGATYPRQDGRFGRDAKATVGTLVKVGGGAAGFDYSKVTNNGTVIVGDGADVSLGAGSSEWACTRDNITELTWEVKTATNTDLRYSGHTYSWYSTSGSTNGGNAGTASLGTDSNTCQTAGRCDTEKFVADVNAAALCSYGDWRLPTRRELSTLVHFGAQNPSIDRTYFPNTVASYFWSASSYVPGPTNAWYVYFIDGYSNGYDKSNSSYVRLVRGGSLCDSSVDDASFVYSSTTYSQCDANPTPTITGLPGGTFSSTPAGLTVNPSTGTINPALSTLGAYVLSYTTNGACPTTATQIITVTATDPPHAAFTANPTSGYSPLTVNFTNNSTNATSYLWEFGTGDTSTASDPTYVYTVGPGNTIEWPASLTATNSNCGTTSATATQIITITGTDPPHAAFTANPLGGETPLAVNFTNNSTGNPTSWLWDFGTGDTSTASDPTYIYISAGSFNVSLTATNSDGSDTITAVALINIDDASFNYTSGTYCQSGSNPTPSITGLPGGAFSSSPAGLSINPSTGIIDLAASALGRYPLSYTTTGTYPNINSITMTITNTTPSATFSYSGSSFSQDGTNPFPIFGPGASAGIFSAPVGVVFVNVNTGKIDLAASTPGTYLITNTIPVSGTCSEAIATTTVIITPSAYQ